MLCFPVMLAGMDAKTSFARSPELMSASDTGLLVVDVQQKLIGLIDGHARIVWNIRRLIDGAKLFNLPTLATEQYPQGLGPTTPELLPLVKRVFEKTVFSCGGSAAFCQELESLGPRKWLLCGIETHVCVQQTVLDLLAEGFNIYVAADAVGSRYSIDYEIALRRMESSGATLTTVEAALFEWCQDSKSAQFKQVSQLVREAPPAA
jgi:nicotinamidase-related amidase